MTHDNVRDALEYAAGILEQNDAGGRLPGRLRQIADVHDDLLTACEAVVKWVPEYMDFGERPCPFCGHHHVHSSMLIDEDDCLYTVLRDVIAASRGEEA